MLLTTSFAIPHGDDYFLDNCKWRYDLLDQCFDNPEFRDQVWCACARDPIFWINSFVWTYDPRLDNPVVPFNTWQFQDTCFETIDKNLGKRDLLIEKSRDMGASWIVLTMFTHRLLFRPYQSFLMVSRKEEYVDKTGDMKGLFQKVDFIIENLPPWMVPPIERNKLHLKNLANGSTIDGESTNGDVGRGDRRTAILKDEFASVENAYEVEAATRDVTKCRVYNSTPKGTGNAFHERREKMMRETPAQVIRMHWSKHPDKNIGLYQYDKENRKLNILDEECEFPEDYHFVKDGKLRSIWYDEQCVRSSNEQEVSQELDIDYKGSGWQFFQQDKLDAVIAEHAKLPVWIGDVHYDELFNDLGLNENKEGPLKLWRQPDMFNKLPGIPTLVLGCDIATGKGGEKSSNSVCVGYDEFSRQKVFEYVINNASPEEFANIVTALGKLFRGEHQQHALLCFEANGPGGQFGKQILLNNYSNLWYRRNEMNDDDKESTTQIGWASTKESKKMLLGQYSESLMNGFVSNCSEAALIECGEYQFQPNGTIQHARSVHTIDPTAQGEAHGDRVIADALAALLLKTSGSPNNTMHESDPNDVPYGSRAYRMRRLLEQQQQHNSRWRRR